jgi:PAS domain S-box-containing protein
MPNNIQLLEKEITDLKELLNLRILELRKYRKKIPPVIIGVDEIKSESINDYNNDSSGQGISGNKNNESGLNDDYWLYKVIFENSEEGLLLTSPDGRIFDANPAATRILGYTREEIISVGREGIVDTTDPRLPGYIEKRLKDGYVTGELTLKCKDGRMLEGEISSRIFYDEKGEAYTSMVFRDITEKKSLQEKLINREKELTTLFEILPVGVSVIDENRNILKTNPAFNKILGIPEENKSEVTKLNRKYLRNDLSIMPSSEFPSIKALDKNIIEQEKEIGILKEDGELIWVSVSAAPLEKGMAVVVTANITERRNAEKLIRDSEEKLKEAQKIAKIGSYHFNIEKGTIKWSDELFNIFGRRKESGEPGYEELSEYYTPESWKVHNELVKNAIEKGENYNVEFEFIKGDNKKNGWLNVIGKVNKDSTGKVFEIFGTAQDITERKIDMQKLNKLNTEILDLYNNAPCGYHSLDKDGVIISINDTQLKWLGYDREEIIGKKVITDFYTQDSINKFNENFPKFKRYGFINDFEVEFIRKDGSIFYANINSTAVFDKKGNFKYSRSSIFDITARKEAEKKLELSSKNWSDTFNAIKDQIWLLDKNGTILQTNKSSDELLCSECESRVGRKCFNVLHSSKTFINDCPFTVMSKSKKREVREQIRNGKIYSVTVDPILNENGDFIGAVHIMSDITKLKEAENQMRDFATHLQKAREEERTEISRTLHDNFGQSLTGLKMELSSLEKKLQKIISVNEYPEIPEKIKSMKIILDDTVALTSKISMELRPNILDMLGLVPAIEWLIKDFREKSGIDCVMENNAETLDFSPRNSTEIFRILQEALTNIVRHANATKVKITITSSLKDYIITVKDNGQGIKDEETRSPYSLGLLGMRERALIFNGKIEISGNANHGTELIIKIPNIKI